MNGLRRAGVAAVLAAAFAPGGVAGQQVPWSVGVGAEAQLFSFNETGDGSIPIRTLSLFTVPVAAQVGLGRNVTLSLGSYFATGSLEREDGTTSRISALTDTQLAATVTLGPAAITGILAAPTGHSTLTDDQIDVAGLIASDLLPFRISNWGTGGGAGVRASAAQRWGRVGAGLSVGFFMARDFTPLASLNNQYRPGNNVTVRGALDANVGQAGKLSLQLSYFNFADDESDGQALYRSGDRFQAVASYAFAAGRRSSAVVYLGGFYRDAGTYVGEQISALPPTPQFLFMGGLGARLRAGGLVWIPSLDLRALRSDSGIDQGYDGRVGLATEIRSGSVTFVPVARFHMGRVEVIQDIESSYLGGALGLTVRLGGSGR